MLLDTSGLICLFDHDEPFHTLAHDYFAASADWLTDTSPDALRVQTECYRRMPVARKWHILRDAYRTARALHAAGVRLRHPVATPAMVQADWRALTLGRLWPAHVTEAPAVDPLSL